MWSEKRQRLSFDTIGHSGGKLCPGDKLCWGDNIVNCVGVTNSAAIERSSVRFFLFFVLTRQC